MSSTNPVALNTGMSTGEVANLLTEEEQRSERIGWAILNPDQFAEYFLQTDLWEQQKEILHAVASQPRVAVKACHSSGKTHLAARAALWFLARYKRSTVVTTAPTWGQVERLLWGEIHGALKYSRYPFPKALNTELKIDHQRYAYGLSTSVTKSDEGVKFQGIHNEHLLMILDEAPGVDPKIWQAIEGNRAGGDVHILAIGNPTISSGPFHDAFTRNRASWKCFTISAFNTPNFDGVPGEGENLTATGEVNTGSKLHTLLSPEFESELDKNVRGYLTTRRWVKEKFYEWGPGHALWESRVLGEFPKQSETSLLSLSWLEQAGTDQRLLDKSGKGKFAAGLDVAGPGEAETSLTIRQGPQIVVHKQWPTEDPRGEVVAILNEYKNDLEVVNVDAVGVGWYIYKHLEDLKFPAVPVIAQAPSNDSEKYRTLKDEFYWGLRMRAEEGDLSGLTDETTIGQLAGIQYKHNSRGQIEIESKEKAADRGVPSPDRAESIMLAFANQALCYGVLDYNKEEQKQATMQKTVGATSLAKPLTSDKQLACSECGSLTVGVCQGGWRCNACGHQWTDRKVIPFAQKRNDSLMKGSQGRF